jgi:hypothetical protein
LSTDLGFLEHATANKVAHIANSCNFLKTVQF